MDKHQKYTGVFHTTKTGQGYVTIEEDGKKENIGVVATYSAGIFNGDTVTVSIQDSARGNRNASDKSIRWGKIVELNKKARNYVIGEYSISDGKEYIMPESYIPFRVQVKNSEIQCAEGDKVIAEINKYKAISAIRVTPIINLGKSNTFDANMRALIYKLPNYFEFSKDVLDEASNIVPAKAVDSLNKRVDLRATPVIAFRGNVFNTASCAFSIYKGDSEWRFGVHVIDIPEYLPAGCAIDREAQSRGRAITRGKKGSPLVPPEFREKCGTYTEEKDYLTVSTFVTFDQNGNVTDTEFCESVVHPLLIANSDDIDVLISGTDSSALLPLRTKYAPALSYIEQLYELAGVLRSRRLSGGGVDFDMCNKIFELEPSGKIGKIRRMYLRSDSDSGLMIIELLAACGGAAAEKMFYSGAGCAYSGTSEKIYDTVTGLPSGRFFLPENDYKYPGYTKREAYTVRGTEFEKYVFSRITDECNMADISVYPMPHYLFKLDKFCEYFRPCEKYSDIVNLRSVKALCREENFDISKYIPSLENETKTANVQKKITSLMTIDYLNTSNKAVFSGSAVKSAPEGMYVLLDCGAYGLLPTASLNVKISAGDRVKVTVTEAVYVTGRVVLSLQP